ncbi:MAG: efflux RND transporter periplasmic adaptor subunit [Gammaproteobacteria bacterium]|nr:MAG: efflux RND transporter periplasmic adaptor subunit [Gammaproteobacteria bacterium]
MHKDAENVIQSWLDLQCQLLVGSRRAIVLLGDPGTGPVLPAATWPESEASTPGLSNAAASALQQRRIITRAKDSAPQAIQQQGDIVAVPILRDKELIGVVTVEFTGRTQVEQQAVAKTLAHNTVWLELLMREKPATDDSPALAVIDLIATCIEHTHFEAAANSTATRLATRLGCERVSLGFVRGNRVEVRTMSGTATLNPKMRLTRAIGKTMDEAIGQDTTIVYPTNDEKSFFATRCHEELVKTSNGGSVCTIPISRDGTLVGAATFEHDREQALDRKTVTLCETVVSLIGPILYEKYLQDRWLGAKISAALTRQLSKFATPGHLVLKAATAAALCAVAFLSTANGAYRVTADAILEGTVQRVVVAPVDGYIKEAMVRAGDIVKEGQVLARLDDRDLELQLRERRSKQAQLQREYRQAMSELDSTRVSILKAQLDQAAARLALTAANLERTRALAPMDGIIISGDLSQSLGTPVARGDTLFEVAPLDSYRVMLKVDERDVRRLSPGQTGQLALVGFPDEYLPFAIERITPIATATDGRNFFAVEAQLEHHPQRLRPGMKGIGKVDIGQRRLIWIWSHNLIDWFRLQAWIWAA